MLLAFPFRCSPDWVRFESLMLASSIEEGAFGHRTCAGLVNSCMLAWLIRPSPSADLEESVLSITRSTQAARAGGHA